MAENITQIGAAWAGIRAELMAQLEEVRSGAEGSAERLSAFVERALDAVEDAVACLAPHDRLDALVERLTAVDWREALPAAAVADHAIGLGVRSLDGAASGNTILIEADGTTLAEIAPGGSNTVVTTQPSFALGAPIDNVLYLGTGDFTGTGTASDNLIAGLAGDDHLSGAGGSDVLIGAWGNDTLSGGEGADLIWGGPGADVFVYTALSDSPLGGPDTLVGFSAADGDVIDLSAIDANAVGGTSNDSFVYVGAAAFSGTAGELRFSDGVLQGDTNGDKVADIAVNIPGASSLAPSSLKV